MKADVWGTIGGECMKITYLEYFVDVVQYGSISKAAEAHYLKQSNLSKCMKAIEDDFKATLLIRSNRGVELTAEGRQVFLWAQKMLEERKALQAAFTVNNALAANTLRGSITIFLSPSINNHLYAQFLVPFLQRYPQIQIHSCEKNISAIVELVAAQPRALGLSILDKKHLDMAASQEALVVLPVKEKIKFSVYVAKDAKFLPLPKSISVKALAKLPLLLYSPSPECLSPVVEILSPYGRLNILQETSNLSLFHSLLLTGQYAAIGIQSSLGMEAYDTIAIRDKIELSSCLLVQRDSLNDALIRAFIQFYCAQQHLPYPDGSKKVT